MQVFISHVYEERHVALVLQKYITQAFSGAFPVFAASDTESIGGGKKWFNHITESLRRSDVVFVLVSGAARRRPWLSFEAGFGDGVGADVIPVSIRGFSLGKLDFPLAGYQGRSVDDLPSILADVTRRLGIASEKQDHSAYLNEVADAEAQMAYKSLEVVPFVQDNVLRFEIKNNGNTDIELLMLETLVPNRYISQSWPRGSNPYMHFEYRSVAGEEYAWFACTSQRGAFGDKKASLRPIITPAMGVVDVHGVRIAVVKDRPQPGESGCDILYQAHAVDYPTDMEKTSWVTLEFR